MGKNKTKTKENFNGIEFTEAVNLTIREKVVGFIVLFVVILAFSVIFSFININNNRIYKNTYIQNIEVSGLTQEEAVEKITKIYREKKIKNLNLRHKTSDESQADFEQIISYDQINVNHEIQKAVDNAYARGRTKGLIGNNYSILFSYIFKKNLDCNITYENNALDSIIKDIELKLPDVTTESSYYIDGENLIVKKGKIGVKVDKEALKNNIIYNLNNFKIEDGNIDIPAYKTEPQKIDIEKISKEITKQPQNAYISNDPKEIHVEEKGIELAVSIEEANKILEEDKEEYSIPLKITEPSVTVASLGTEAFANKLASFTTNYDASNINRNNNLVLAAEKLNGTIVNPGEEFSYNKTIGERTIAAGFKEAKAYAGGDVVLDVGGGICQLSSTLYNAALYTNLDITERHSHYFQTSYVEAGRDATVSWGSVDFKFKNNRKYPIKIEAKAGEGVVTVNIYGIKQSEDVTVLIESKVTSIIERKTEYKKTGNPREGEDGCTSETYKTVLKNGIVLSKSIISKDTYNALSKIVIE